MPHKHHLVIKTLLVTSSLLVAVACCELFLRIAVRLDLLEKKHGFAQFMKKNQIATLHMTGSNAHLFRFTDDTELGWEPIPQAEYNHIRINSAGFRGPEYALQPANNTVRVAVIGDSETFCQSLEEELTFTARLEYELNRKQHKHFEVLNFGVPGYDTSQEAALLRKKVLRFHPDIVLLNYVFNDPAIENRAILLNSGLLSWSYLYMFYKFNSRPITPFETIWLKYNKDLVKLYHYLHSSAYFIRTVELLQQMASTLQKRKIPFFIMVQPELTGPGLREAYPYLYIHKKLATLEGKNLRIIDTYPAVAKLTDNPHDLWVAPKDPHKNARALEIMAQTTADHILTSFPGIQGDE